VFSACNCVESTSFHAVIGKSNTPYFPITKIYWRYCTHAIARHMQSCVQQAHQARAQPVLAKA
jgi:hypothetical protein